MKSCKKKINDIGLFHITNKSNIRSIKERGLLPEISDLTREAYTNQQIDIEGIDTDDVYSNPEIIEDINNHLDEKYPDGVVFVTDIEGLSPMIDTLSHNSISGYGKDNVAVFGIKKGCEKMFRKEEVGSDADVISETPIPPECLCFIDKKTWDGEYKKFRSPMRW